jgi:osmotically-inducible protein OsmY
VSQARTRDDDDERGRDGLDEQGGRKLGKLMAVMAALEALRIVEVRPIPLLVRPMVSNHFQLEAIMKSDRDIERDVRDELQWEPDLDATDIAVSARDGVVTLTGFVKSYTDKYEAEAAAKRVAGVSGIANDLEVRMPSVDERPDPEIARDAVSAIKSQLPISSEHIKVVVKNGWVTLEGQAEWQYQKSTAENAVRRIKGVKGVSNLIMLKPRAEPTGIKNKIMEAFKRNAELDANRIHIEANGSEVILKGTVRSWIEREEAERVAWSAPGVTRVEDRIVVVP